MVAEYEKESGNTIDYSLIPFAPLMQKIVSAITSGDVPDLISHDVNDQVSRPAECLGRQDRRRHRRRRNPKVAIITRPPISLRNTTTTSRRQRGFYLIPFKTAVLPFHIWISLVEKAGFKLADAPKTWDAFWDFFKPMQQKLRDQGMRDVYSLGLQCTTTGPADGNNLFHAIS